MYDASGEIEVGAVSVSVGKIEKFDIKTNIFSDMNRFEVGEIYVGGIAGRFSSGLIEDCSFGEKANIS